MKEIELTRGKLAMVDNGDYDELIQWEWTANLSKGKWYARRHLGNRKYMSMHRQIMGNILGVDFDHKDGNGLNNQRHNLRECTHIQNMQNGLIKSNNTSGYKGVSWYKNYGKWLSRIVVNRQRVCLGYFDDIIDAAMAYDNAAKKYFGEFARTNF
jgi:AP2 domain-containing protein